MLPTEHLVHDEPYILKLEEYVATFEDLLQITITKLGDQVDLVEII